VSEVFISAFIRIYPQSVCMCLHVSAFNRIMQIVCIRICIICLHFSAIMLLLATRATANRQPTTMMSTSGQSVCNCTNGSTSHVSGRGDRGPPSVVMMPQRGQGRSSPQGRGSPRNVSLVSLGGLYVLCFAGWHWHSI
jgi:hypothetical protein